MNLQSFRIRIALALLCAALLSGCGAPGLTAKAPQDAAAPADTPVPAAEPAEEAAPGDGETQNAVVLQTELPSEAGGTRVRLERAHKDADDPAEGKLRILSYAWDSVRVLSDRDPAVAEAITEDMAVEQELWYTGAGEEDCDRYGYDAMLAAAEDGFTAARENGAEPAVCFASRSVTVLRANEEVCVFLITTTTDLGSAQPSTVCRLLCYDMRTGDRLPAVSDAGDAETLRKAVDTRFPAVQAAETAAVKLLPLDGNTETAVEIVDQVVIGDGGEACLLVFEGQALDVEICSVQFSDRFIADQQLFFCGEMRDSALQLALLFPGDLPNTMLRYRDSEGEHEYLISMSGLDGSIILSKNTF